MDKQRAKNSSMNNSKNERYFCWFLFTVYLAGLFYFLFFAEATGRTGAEHTYQYNLVPLHEIKRFFIYRRQLGIEAVTLNLFGNVAAFIPFGLFLPLLWHRLRFFSTVLVTGIDFSLLVELLQLCSRVGSFDVDDILLNTIGVVIGYGIFLIVNAVRNRHGIVSEIKTDKKGTFR